MEVIRSILRDHGASATKALLDQAVREEMQLLERRLQEIRAYIGSSPAEVSVSAIAPLPQEAIAKPEESMTSLQQDESKKTKRVKPSPNSNRMHPIARAKAAKAEAAPTEQTHTNESSETDKKPPSQRLEGDPEGVRLPRGVLKAEQRRKENAKRRELEEAGIIPTSLLTKENLQEWLSAGKTYSQIAREEVGLREEDVSAAARKHGLSSQKTQRLTGKENVLVVKEQV